MEPAFEDIRMKTPLNIKRQRKRLTHQRSFSNVDKIKNTLGTEVFESSVITEQDSKSNSTYKKNVQQSLPLNMMVKMKLLHAKMKKKTVDNSTKEKKTQISSFKPKHVAKPLKNEHITLNVLLDEKSRYKKIKANYQSKTAEKFKSGHQELNDIHQQLQLSENQKFTEKDYYQKYQLKHFDFFNVSEKSLQEQLKNYKRKQKRESSLRQIKDEDLQEQQYRKKRIQSLSQSQNITRMKKTYTQSKYGPKKS